MDDAQLFQKYCTTRSDAAFAALVATQIDLAYSVALRHVRDPHLADDVTQAVFIILAEKAAMLPSSTNIAGWIFRTTQYVARNAIRKLARRRRHEEKFAQSRPEAVLDPSAGVGSENLAIIDKALARLGKADQEAILMKYYCGQSWQEIGSALGLNEEAARKRISRSLARLRSLLPVGMGAVVLTEYLPAHAISAAPIHLTHCVLQNVSVHAGIAAGHGSAFTLAKGTLMTMAKVKFATVAAAVVLLMIPTAAMVIHSARPSSRQGMVQAADFNLAPAGAAPSQLPAASAVAPPAPAPAPYALASGHPLKRIVDAPEDVRRAFWRSLSTPNVPLQREPPDAFIISLWKENGAPRSWSWNPDDRPYMLSGVLQNILHMFPQQMEGDDFLFPGDFIYGQAATEEELRAALEKIIREDLHEPLVLTFREVPRKVLVLKGRWKYTPDAASPRAKPQIPSIELYEKSISKDIQSMSIGDVAEFAGQLGKALNEQVVMDAQGVPERFSWIVNDSKSDVFGDKTPVLDHVARQTGLSWSEETRNVRRLFVEEKK